ncbi:unnamed protein product [Orchesella dallaii]|uniref:Uncharacterized protein n=1 Tax=Orchesella dallaii TaxID=48710 RepID=A0ABP1S639_9HEXA
MILLQFGAIFYGKEVTITGLHSIIYHFDTVMTKHSKRKSRQRRHSRSQYRYSDEDHHRRRSSEEHRLRQDAGASRRYSYISRDSEAISYPADPGVRRGSRHDTRQSMAAQFTELRRSSDQTTPTDLQRSAENDPHVLVDPNNPNVPMIQIMGTSHLRRLSIDPISARRHSTYSASSRRRDSTYSSAYPTTDLSTESGENYNRAATNLKQQYPSAYSLLGTEVQIPVSESSPEHSLQLASFPQTERKPVPKLIDIAKYYFIVDMILAMLEIAFIIHELVRDGLLSKVLNDKLCNPSNANKQMNLQYILGVEFAARLLDVIGNFSCIFSIVKWQHNLSLVHRFTIMLSIICSFVSMSKFHCAWVVELAVGILLIIHYFFGLYLNIYALEVLQRARIPEPNASVNVNNAGESYDEG